MSQQGRVVAIVAAYNEECFIGLRRYAGDATLNPHDPLPQHPLFAVPLRP
jgi:hypothetical protein